MSNANTGHNQPVEEQVHANLYALQEELADLQTELPSYEDEYYDRALARIAEIEHILYRAEHPQNANANANASEDPNVESEDPSTNARANQTNAANAKGGRRRKQRKTRRKQRKGKSCTRSHRHRRTSRR
jgi:hypothetical protein